MTSNSILILNGPGLADTSEVDLGGIASACEAACQSLSLAVEFRQTDDREELFRWITGDASNHIGLIINPALSADIEPDMYQLALREIAPLNLPVIEVHLDNIFSSSADSLAHKPSTPLQVPEAHTGLVCGLGTHGYVLAVRSIADQLEKNGAER